MNKLLIFIIALLFLTGCVDMQKKATDQKVKVELQNYYKARDEIIAECNELDKNPKINPIRGKIIGYDEKGISKRTRYSLIEDIVTEPEKEALLIQADNWDVCSLKRTELERKYFPMLLPAYVEYNKRELSAFSELYHGRISYGEYNRLYYQSGQLSYNRRKELHEEYMSLPIPEQTNRIQANQLLFQAGMILSRPAPQLQRNTTHTQCSWMGNFLNCTSR